MKRLIPIFAIAACLAAVVYAQVRVGDYLAPLGEHPATVSDYHRGGWHQGASTTNVYPFVLVPGMAFYDTAAEKLYVLDNSTNWVEFAPPAADPRIVIQEQGATSVVYVVHSDGHTNKIGSFCSE